jgi:hypothetical protein
VRHPRQAVSIDLANHQVRKHLSASSDETGQQEGEPAEDDVGADALFLAVADGRRSPTTPVQETGAGKR